MSVKCKKCMFKIHLVLRMQRIQHICAVLSFILLTGCTNDDTGKKDVIPSADSSSKTEQLLNDSTTTDSMRVQLIEQLVQDSTYDKALLQIEKLLQKDSSNPGWLYIKADALEKMGDTASAILNYNKAVNSAGIFIDAEIRAAILFAEKADANALKLCDRLLANPGAVGYRSDVLRIKGIYYAKSGNSKKAIEQFNQIISEDYTYLDAYIEKGLVYFDTKNYKDAWTVFAKSTEVSNKFAEGYFWMAKAEERMNQKAEAAANYKRALALDQSLSEARQAIQRLETK